MMTEKGIAEIDLTQDEEHYDAGWVMFDVTDSILAGCIDSVYDAIYQRI